jgi:hypothetical protein
MPVTQRKQIYLKAPQRHTQEQEDEDDGEDERRGEDA